jgi:hypothetical protein
MAFWGLATNFVRENPELVTLVSVCFGLGSILVSIMLYRMGRASRLLAYSMRTFPIVSRRAGKVPGLQVEFHGQPADGISVTRLAIWNAGTEPLRDSDVAEADPVRIEPRSGVRAFRAELIEVTSAANRSSVTADGEASNRWLFRFAFLDSGDGVLVSIVHDGSGRQDLVVRGSLIGGRIRRAAADSDTMMLSLPPFAPAAAAYVESGRRHDKFLAAMGAVLSVLLLGGAFVAREPWLGMVAVIVLVMAAGCHFHARRSYPPPRIRRFDDDI